MKLLIIEDNDIKFELVADFLRKSLGVANLTRAASYQSGVESLVNYMFDFVILDMTLPISDLESSPVGMDFLAFGGEYILRECLRRHISTKIIVVSQYGTFVRDNKEVSFEQLRAEILPRFEALVLGCVRLDRDSDSWKTEIINLITNENIDN